MTARVETLVEAAVAVESLRQENPMNGDGLNLMLDRALSALDQVAGCRLPSAAARASREVKDAYRDARYIDRNGGL